ncbi:uncharacterized protein METZ01_LOCUS54884 [marine metagenome]|uniref:Phosphoglucosamine mutase n=1 Tax=marine metagenome TaxID=408172 RepID=A0A381SD91_9ZZZZ|tara:strand:+ start:1387 stop:2730 length:1344 start_codon:yes stop_codon:yes gene_type:complete
MTQRLFGTDGIRGAAGKFPLDGPTVIRIGAALMRSLDQNHLEKSVVIGRDTRESSQWIEHALAVGAAAEGARVTSIGVAPTPAVAFLTASGGFDAGVVISASHNPYGDNGIKIFTAGGIKLNEQHETALAKIVRDDSWTTPDAGSAPVVDLELLRLYLQHIRSVLPNPTGLGPMRLAVDCANGATAGVAPRLFGELGFEVITTGCEPNGRNINDGCGSTHPEHLSQFVKARECPMGVALDGDGDRAIFVDGRGHILDGDKVLFVCAKHLQSENRLRGDAVVATEMSNVGLKISLEDLGITLVRCAVGDKYVMETLTEQKLALGGEQSGHIIFPDILPTGDGLLTTLMILQAMTATGRELDSLAEELMVYPQVLVNVRVREKTNLETLPDVAGVIAEVEQRVVEQRGRLFVRYSGTEPVLRIMLEGRDQSRIKHWAEKIAEVVERRLG